MSKIGITSKKIAHYITANSSNGLAGYWDAVCGKWISPKSLLDDEPLPGNVRMCKQCASKGPVTIDQTEDCDK